MTTTIEVLGLGNSLVDILAHADDAYLEAQDMAKGAMTLIDEDRAEALYAARVDPIVVSGGSAANTIVGVASLGVSAAYIGKVKHDPLGKTFVDDIRVDRRAVRHPSGRARAGHGALLRLRHARRRAHDEHLPRRQHLPRPAGRRRGPRPRGEGRLSGRLHVGPAGGQVRLPESGSGRPCGRAAGRADPVGFLLRRPVPRRVHRPHALEDGRHHLLQHRRAAFALRDASFRARRSTRCAPRACSGS